MKLLRALDPAHLDPVLAVAVVEDAVHLDLNPDMVRNAGRDRQVEFLRQGFLAGIEAKHDVAVR